MKTSVDEAIAVIRGYCDKITSCRECRYRSWTLSCSFKEKFPCDWDMDVGSEVEKGEQEE